MMLSVTLPAAVTFAYHRRRYREAPWKWHAVPAGLLVALACVLFSRLTRFEPGYLYGVMCGIAFTRRLGRNPRGHIAFLTTLATIVVSVAAWFARVPLSHTADAHPGSVALAFADDILATMFIGGLVGSFFAVIPPRGWLASTSVGGSRGRGSACTSSWCSPSSRCCSGRELERACRPRATRRDERKNRRAASAVARAVSEPVARLSLREHMLAVLRAAQGRAAWVPRTTRRVPAPDLDEAQPATTG